MLAKGAEKWLLIVMAVMMASVFISFIISIAFAIILVIMLIIYRDPDIPIAHGVVSPIDGKIISVDHADKSIILKLDIMGKRVMRAPISGILDECSVEKSNRRSLSGLRWKKSRFGFALFYIRSPNISIHLSILERSKVAIYPLSTPSVLRGDRICFIPWGRLVKLHITEGTADILVEPDMLVLAGESTLAKF